MTTAVLESAMSSCCAICQVLIDTENDTAEHIIPRSIGGRRTVKGFICRACNSEAGGTWDNELFDQLHWFTVMLGIKRQGGLAPDIRVESVAGPSYAVSADGGMSELGSPVKRSEDGKTFQIRARDIDEATKMLRQIHKRYPTFDVAEVLATMEFTSTPVDKVLKASFEFGGAFAGRSMVKTAMALAYSLGVPTNACDLSTHCLTNLADVDPSLAEHLVSDLVVDRPPRFFNCVAILGDPVKRRLVGYVEYFGVCRWVIHLSSSYTGPAVRGVYCLDSISGQEMPLEVNLNLSDKEFAASLADRTFDDSKRQLAFQAAMPLVQERRAELARAAAVNHAIVAATTAMGIKPDSPLDETQFHEFAGRVSRMLAESLVLRRGSRVSRVPKAAS